METPRSYTFSSKGFLRNILITLIILIGIEVYLSYSMRPFERQNSETPMSLAESSSTPGFFSVGKEEPVEFLTTLRSTITGHPIVFIGDSQGIRVRGGGMPYPEQVAELICSTENRLPVVSMHIQGTNVYEQSIMLLCMLKLGIEPFCIIWSSSVYSLRENEIRSELMNSYTYVENEISEFSMAVVLPMSQSNTNTPNSSGSLFLACRGAARDIYLELASVRFMQRSLLEKAEILRRSPVGRFLGIRTFGTAHQSNPSASILVDAASVMTDVSTLLEDRGSQTIVFLAPFNRRASQRAFSQEAEETVLSALESGMNSTGVQFIDMSAELSRQYYGDYTDGTEDPLHFDQTGHSVLAERFRELIDELLME